METKCEDVVNMEKVYDFKDFYIKQGEKRWKIAKFSANVTFGLLQLI